MESIIFCKISSMKYYKGAGNHDQPFNGGTFVRENGHGHEEYNFLAREISNDWDDDSGTVPKGEYCRGYVATKSTIAGKINQLHVERIRGFGKSFKKEPCVSGVTVIWFATCDLKKTTVVGWYRNATVFREYQNFYDEDGNKRWYNVLAKASECVLLPQKMRNKNEWWVPSKKYAKYYGFGQSMLWYAQEEDAKEYLKEYLEQLIGHINEYNAENWLYTFPEG